MGDYSLFGLFISAFISSTLFPGGSEAVLLYMANQPEYDHFQLWWVASVGNTLGGMTSWVLGYWVASRYPAEGLVKASHQRSLFWLKRWGSPVLLLSWLPVVGDPLCVVAGWLRMNWLPSLLLILMGKAARYGVLLFFV
ncbi:MAG TPA: DedA family protein [Gammaproteobacteria bacterium]|nr:DedA family protein [Gammaproteobacteria bacterium]